jgi:hypothetical protein
MPDTFIEMDFDEWCDTYKPIKNHIDKDSSFNGEMFETYGDEVAFVKQQDPACIWTYGDGDDGGSYVWNGWSFVNRIGYFITEVPCPPEITMQMRVSFNWFYCENCSAEFEDPDNTITDAFDEADLQKCPECATLEEMTLVGLENKMDKDPINEVEQDEEETVFHSFSERTVQI